MTAQHLASVSEDSFGGPGNGEGEREDGEGEEMGDDDAIGSPPKVLRFASEVKFLKVYLSNVDNKDCILGYPN